MVMNAPLDSDLLTQLLVKIAKIGVLDSSKLSEGEKRLLEELAQNDLEKSTPSEGDDLSHLEKKPSPAA